jgi:hypothetical protein
MPAKSEKQRRFMGAELARKRAGKKTKTGMTESQLKDYAKTPPIKKRPHGSGEFSAEDIKRGYKKGQPVDMGRLAREDVEGQNANYDEGFGRKTSRDVGSDFEE